MVWLRVKLNKTSFEGVNIPSPKKPSLRQGKKRVRKIEKPQYKLLLDRAPGGPPRPVQLRPARSRIQGPKPLNYQKLNLHFKTSLEGLGIKYFHKIYKINDTLYLIPGAHTKRRVETNPRSQKYLILL